MVCKPSISSTSCADAEGNRRLESNGGAEGFVCRTIVGAPILFDGFSDDCSPLCLAALYESHRIEMLRGLREPLFSKINSTSSENKPNMLRTSNRLACRIWCLAILVLGASFAHAWGQSAEVAHLLSRMTLRQEIRLVHGERESPASYQGQAGYLAGESRLGIEAMRFADGPPGVLTRHRSTALTCTMGLAATFSRHDAYLNGVVIGRDARALGIQVALQPFLNLMRDPTWVRAYNTYGEDPLLTGIIGASVIRGIQGQGVMAEAKHFLAYNGANDVVVGSQALHEIYAEPFRYAVRAGVASIMCSYNEINGRYSCDNRSTLRDLLRRRWHFRGFVTSDWGATHSASFIEAGLDLEMPGSVVSYLPCYFCATVPPSQSIPHGGIPFAPSPFHIPEEPRTPVFYMPPMARPHGMLTALRTGRVSVARITRAAGRILGQMQRFGLLATGTPAAPISSVPFTADLPIVERTAEDGAVLLMNRRHILPLMPGDFTSLALIGPGAGQVMSVGQSGERGLGFPGRDISPLQALRRYAAKIPGSHISFAVGDDMTGTPIPAALLSHAGRPGLIRRPIDGSGTQINRQLDFTFRQHDALPAGSSYIWRGSLRIRRTGNYWIYLQLLGCSGTLKIDGKVRAQSSNLFLHGTYLQPDQDNVLPTTDDLDDVRVAVKLIAGVHRITVIEHGDGSGRPVQIRLNWMTPTARARDFAAALAAARHAKTVIVFAWSRGRPAYALPGEQNRLISDIAAINPRTIVVLNTSEPAALPWVRRVPALLEMWYPGDGGGVSTAAVLTGRADPSGHLPFTWARRLDQYVSHDPAHPGRSSSGVNGVTHFSEGIFIGYRWFDHKGIGPLFPFGYGLTYTHFVYRNLHVTQGVNGGLRARFTITNVGRYFGTAVPQIYLGPPPPQSGNPPFAVKALAGFTRVHLAPDESQRVTIDIPHRQLEYWSTTAQGWRLARGPRIIYVSTSSRDVRIQKQVTLGASGLQSSAAGGGGTVAQRPESGTRNLANL